MSMDRDIQFLFEMGALKNMPRQWSRFYNTDFENISEHHFRVIWTALIIAYSEKNVDIEKIMKMALVHDITESRNGDVDFLSRQYVERKEELAIKDILRNTSLEKEFLAVWEEYEERESIESKIVKDADNLVVDFELREQSYKASPLPKVFEETRQFVAKNELYTKTAKKLWRMVRQSDPMAWFIEGRNRLNSKSWGK